MLDLKIVGGRVVTPMGVGMWDIGVEGGKIVALTVAGGLPQDTGKTIDASGKIVLPGGVEAHTHVQTPLSPSAWVRTLLVRPRRPKQRSGAELLPSLISRM